MPGQRDFLCVRLSLQKITENITIGRVQRYRGTLPFFGQNSSALEGRLLNHCMVATPLYRSVLQYNIYILFAVYLGHGIVHEVKATYFLKIQFRARYRELATLYSSNEEPQEKYHSN